MNDDKPIVQSAAREQDVAAEADRAHPLPRALAAAGLVPGDRVTVRDSISGTWTGTVTDGDYVNDLIGVAPDSDSPCRYRFASEITRNDGDGQDPQAADDGSGDRSDLDSYDEEVEVIRQGLEYERCHECGGDLGDHVIAPDPFGHAHAWCERDTQDEAGEAHPVADDAHQTDAATSDDSGVEVTPADLEQAAEITGNPINHADPDAYDAGRWLRDKVAHDLAQQRTQAEQRDHAGNGHDDTDGM